VTDKDEPLRVVDRRWWARQASAEATEPEPERERKPSYVEDLEQQLADKTAHLQAIATEHRRALEEFEQAKLRIRREMARDVERGKRAVVAELLEVLDNLDRAIAAARDSARGGPQPDRESSVETLLRGVELVRDQFLAKLEALGVRRIDALGQMFDAAAHEAVSMAPVSHPEQDGRVVGVAREGYAIGDELLRPAAVVVGRLD
jgi:molecular chaperone GrpE